MEFRVLGPLEVSEPRAAVNLGGPKQRALLAVLLLHANQAVSVDRLLDELWGPEPPRSGPTSLQNYVSRLRKVLGPDVLVRRGDGYVLRVDPERTDLGQFETLLSRAREGVSVGEIAPAAADLRQALALWRGRALADVSFEGVARGEVARLDELYASALEERIETDLALGRHAELVAELEALVVRYPLRERLRGQLILALYRSGRQAEALAVYQETRRTLLDELGIDPSPPLQRLERSILLQDPVLEAPSVTAVPEVMPETVPTPVVEDELRPVTALFADVVGSTSLGERLPANEVKALIGECVTQMSRAVEEYGGIVQAYGGDGICAYFGVPAAHEDDPERAARTALRILEVVGEYSGEIRAAWDIDDFDVRIGINSGQTAVGLVGAGEPRAVALGDTTNVAARLQAAAAPGTIAVGEHTAKRLQHRFVLEPLGELTVKGRTKSIVAWRLQRPQTQARAAPPVPVVGRSVELERLRTVVSGLAAGRGQVLFITGEAGVGKTRLLQELRRLASDDVTWLQGHCVSYGGLASWPFIEVLRAWLGADIREPEVSVRTKARAKLGELFGPGMADVLTPLAWLLRIRLDPVLEDRAASASETIAGQIQRAYASWIEAVARERPVVLALEDVHWADSATRELAESALELTDRAPLLIVATLRVDVGSEGSRFRLRALGDYPHRTTELALGPLDDDSAGRLLGLLAPGAFDEEARAALVMRAEGNPLYLDELLRFLLESGGLERRRTLTLTAKAASLPPALENLLVARVDLLSKDARQLAQIAAVIGRTFPVRVLERVAGERIDENLAVLLRAEIVREVRRYPEFECAFRNGLLQEATLSTLTPSRRRELSQRVATEYEAAIGSAADDELERLAHYYAQADDLEKALDLLERAAERSLALDAGSRASELLSRGRTLAARLHDVEAERRLDERLGELRVTAAR